MKKAGGKKKIYERNFRKTITTRSNQKFVVVKRNEQFAKSKRYADTKDRKDSLISYFRRTIAPRFERFYNQTKKSSKRLYIFSVQLNKNLRTRDKKGFRLKGGFSLRRRKISNENSFRKLIDDYEKEFLKSLEKYLHRKDLLSITIPEIGMEVVHEGVSAVTAKRSKRKTKKTVRRVRRRK